MRQRYRMYSPLFAGSLLLAILLGLTACTTLDVISNPGRAADSAFREAAREAGREAGREVGRQVGQAVVRHYTPQFMRWYTGYLSRMAFNSQGHSVESATRPYAAGEYTEWAVLGQDGDDPVNHMRRALLREEGNGNQWWQVIYYDAAGDDTIVMESLFTPDREQMLRMRVLFPDDEQPQEIPVEEHNYQAPTRLTRESIEGASEGREAVSVAAGDFRAERVRFGHGGGMEQTWWLDDSVPGGVVRYAVSSRDGDQPDEAEQMPTENYVLELQDYGRGASSQLGI